MNRIILLTLLSINVFAAYAQKNKTSIPTYTNAKDRLAGVEQRKKLEENSLVSNVKFRSVGPTIMSGRIVDIDANPTNSTQFYAAYASGGLWHTDNNGTSFRPLFDNEAVMTIGDIAVDWNNNENIWIGTGESNSSRSSYSGVGVFKSSDKGKTWQHKGLEETHHISRVIIHPKNPDVLWVAAIGHLYTPNKERGIFKTTDGGKTWKHTLFVNDITGAIDLIIDPSNPDVLYAAMWQRERSAWNFSEAGKSSGIYKSTNGGESWQLVSTGQSGFPTGDDVGRIGLANSPADPKIIYAIVDNNLRRKQEDKDKTEGLKKDQLKTISAEEFLKIDDQKLNAFLEENGFPEKHTAATLKQQVKAGKLKPSALAEYLEDANSLLFDTPVTGAEIYRSEDGGTTWKKTHSNYLEDLYYSYGYYFGYLKASPTNTNEIYIAGVPLLKSVDGGKTFSSISGQNMHGDHHAMWVNPSLTGHLINGNDGGINVSYDDGKSWSKLNSPAVGQFYTVNVDMEKPYNVYGGLQDNGVWYGPSTYKENLGWQYDGNYPYKRLYGGDGMQVQIDSRDNNTVYTGYQFGNYARIDKKTGEAKSIQPSHELGERPLRFNWQTPIHLSKHNEDILYFGSNKFHRSMNKGDDFQTLSGDLTNGGKKGDVAYGTLTSIDESPLKFGLIYVGSDDGLVHVSKDGGNSWKKISTALPQNFWVSRVVASAHNERTVYVSLNGYRQDIFTAFLFKSDDYGTTWQRIGTDLPAEPVNVIKEDPTNKNILYTGTDHGLYVSINRGKTFNRMTNNMPAVPVHDLVIHKRDKDLVVGTHGRSIYIAPVAELQQLTDSVLNMNIYAFNLNSPTYSKNWGKKWDTWEETEAKEFQLPYYLKQKSKTTISIKTENGTLVKQFTDEGEAGLNYALYDLSVDSVNISQYEKTINESIKEENKKVKLKAADDKKYYLQAGKYTVEFETAGNKATTTLVIKPEKSRKRE